MEVAGSGWEKEYRVALLAVQRAVILTKTVLSEVDKGALSKEDDSPVTVADFGAQALLIDAVRRHFPDDGFIGEESADALRKDSQLCDRVWELVAATRLDDDSQDDTSLGRLTSKEEMLDAIDRGSGRSQGGRVWVLDPIDGTQAFVGGGQYAVALALVEDGVQRVGVLGCPNLGIDHVSRGEVNDVTYQRDASGVMLSAVCGHGAYIRPSRGKLLDARKIERREQTGTPLRFVDSLKSRTTDLEGHQRVASRLGSSWPGTRVLSLQMRYVALAIGGCDVMIRIPRDENYREPVWDHAGGALILEEAGGKVTDISRKPVEFGHGRRLQNSHGIVAAPKDVHTTVLTAVQGILKQNGQ